MTSRAKPSRMSTPPATASHWAITPTPVKARDPGARLDHGIGAVVGSPVLGCDDPAAVAAARRRRRRRLRRRGRPGGRRRSGRKSTDFRSRWCRSSPRPPSSESAPVQLGGGVVVVVVPDVEPVAITGEALGPLGARDTMPVGAALLG